MRRILFVCRANVFRSRLAESIMNNMVANAGKRGEYVIDSAGTEPDYGLDMLPDAVSVLKSNGIFPVQKEARALSPYEYDSWDRIICMDRGILRDATSILGGDPDGKLHLFSETGVPESCLNDIGRTFVFIAKGCAALLFLKLRRF